MRQSATQDDVGAMRRLCTLNVHKNVTKLKEIIFTRCDFLKK